MGCHCKTVTTGILLLLLGIALASIFGVFWLQFLRVSVVIGSDRDVGSLVAVYVLSAWIVGVMVMALIMVIVSGIIGIISGVQRGQCINLTYLVVCVITCFLYAMLVIASSYVMSVYCEDGFDKCFSDRDRKHRNIFMLCLVIVSFVIMVLSLIGSVLSCRARCYCCGATPKGRENGVNQQDNLAMIEIPISPAGNNQTKVEPSAPAQAMFFP